MAASPTTSIKQLNSLTTSELSELRDYLTEQERAELDALLLDENAWQGWLEKYFPNAVSGGFCGRFIEFWEWVWSIEPAIRPRPFVAIWPRGGGKSTSAELAVVAICTRKIRKYCIYVCETQVQADDHVASIAAKLEELGVQRKLGKYGNSQGWRRNRLRTNNFTIDALGLDVASRGKKIDDDRPDLIVFDDVDSQNDSPAMIDKKKKTITSSILPAMAAGCAVLFAQNLIHANSIASQLADGRADFLIDRIVSGPHPAATELETKSEFDESIGRIRTIVTKCVPTWKGQGKQQIQEAIDTYGKRSFDRESMQNVYENEGALWSRKLLDKCYVDTIPELKRIVVAVDPSGGGDEIGIAVGGIGYDGYGYLIADETVKGQAGPGAWGAKVVSIFDKFKADRIVAEKNFGGDMVKSTIHVQDSSVPVRMVVASRGKAVRAEPVSALYGEMDNDGEIKALGNIRHCGVFTKLETEMTTWTPNETWSPNRMDALVWLFTELMLRNPNNKRKAQSFSFGSM